MNNNTLYRNVFSKGLQESPLFEGCERSPMTSLANTLLGASLANTPCKRLSLSSSVSDTPQSLKDESFSSASKDKSLSPPLLKSPHNKENLATYYLPSNAVQRVRIIQSPLKEVQNTVTRTLNFSPLKKVSPARREHRSPLENPIPPDEYDSNSRDSGYSESGQKRDGFNVPRSCAPTRRLNLDMSPFKSPSEGRKVRSFASLKKKSEDDELLMEFICGATDISTDDEDDGSDQHSSASLSSLFSAPIQSHLGSVCAVPQTISPPVLSVPGGARLPIRRCLSMVDTSTPLSSRNKHEIIECISESFEELTNKKPMPATFKRPQSPHDDSFVIESKRRKDDLSKSIVSLEKESDDKVEKCVKEESSKVVLSQRHLSNPESESKDLVRPKLLRCHSESHVSIMKAVSVSSNSTEELTGDFTQTLSLPTVQGGKHPDLKSINIHTMAELLRGKYDDKIASFKVLDCRYPYEYEGGHIKNAINWHNLKMVQEYLDAQKASPKISAANTPRHIHIFHCEFSAERGPKAQRMLREIDRTINKEHYPALHFPEIYLLEGGYKAFFEAYPDLCTPNDYVKMLDEKHAEDLKFFRSKSRSWVAENKLNRCPTVRAGPKRLGL